MENPNPNPNPNGKNSQQTDSQLTQKQVPKLTPQNAQQIQENSQNFANNNSETQKQIHFPIENPSLKKLEKNNSSNSQNSANKRNFEQFQNQSENVLNESQNQDTEILEEQEAQSDQHSVSKHSSSYEEQPGTPIVDNNQSYSHNTNNLNVNNSSLINDSLQNSQDEIGNSDKENFIEQQSQENTNQTNSINQSQQHQQNNQQQNKQYQIQQNNQQPPQKPLIQFQQRHKLLKLQDEIEYSPKKNQLFTYKLSKINTPSQIQVYQDLINKQLHQTAQNTNKNYDHFYLQELTLNFTNNLLDFEKNFELLQNTLEQIAFSRSSQQKTQCDSLIVKFNLFFKFSLENESIYNPQFKEDLIKQKINILANNYQTLFNQNPKAVKQNDIQYLNLLKIYQNQKNNLNILKQIIEDIEKKFELLFPHLYQINFSFDYLTIPKDQINLQQLYNMLSNFQLKYQQKIQEILQNNYKQGNLKLKTKLFQNINKYDFKKIMHNVSKIQTQMPTLQQIQQKQNQPVQQPIQFQLENLGFIHTFIKKTLNPQNHHLKQIKILEKDINQDANTNQNTNQNQIKELQLQQQQQPQNEYIYTVNFHPTPTPTPRKNSQTQKLPNSNGDNLNNNNNNININNNINNNIKNNNNININNHINNNNNINIQKLIADQKKSQNLELNFPVPLIFRNQEPVFHKFNLGWQNANLQRVAANISFSNQQKEQLINQIDFHTEVFLEKKCTIEQLLIAYYKVKHHKFCNQFENFYNVQVSNFQNEYIIVDISFQYPDYEIQEDLNLLRNSNNNINIQQRIQGNSEQQAGNQMEIEENQSEETEEDLDQEDTQDSNTEQ